MTDHVNTTGLPPDSTVVRARVVGWAEAQVNNLLPEPDPALPTLEGVEEWQTGRLTSHEVSIPEQHIRYRRYMVNGFDVDADTIERLS